MLILLVPSMADPTMRPQPASPRSSIVQENQGGDTLADGQSAYSGKGVPLAVKLSGVKAATGTATIDKSHSGYLWTTPPSGWSGDSLSAAIDDISTLIDVTLANGLLNAYHNERWFGLGYDSDVVVVPNSWTLVKKEDTAGSGRSPHPIRGIFRFRSNAGYGYDNGYGFYYQASWSSGNVLYPTDEIYLSQQVGAPYREVRSAEVRFFYRVRSTSNLQDQVHLFVRLAGYETKLHVLEPGDPTDTWLEAVVPVPPSTLAGLSTPNALLLCVGLATDLSGSQTSAANAYVQIDEIKLTLGVRPFPEQVGLKANGASVTGVTSGSVSPFVPDDSSRDCYSAPDRGIDLNGYDDNGVLEVGCDALSQNSVYQIAFQFPVSVFQGAAITSARLEVEAESGAANTPGMRVYVANEDTVSAFTSGFPVVKNRYQWVDTSLDWLPSAWSAGVRYVSPDIAALVQKVISRAGWSSGNYILVMMDYIYSGSVPAYNNAKGSTGYLQADLARLYVDYLVPQSDSLNSFLYKKEITISRTKVTADLVNFPLYLDIYDPDLRTKVQPDGDDIAFMIGSQTLDHEIELFQQSYNGTHAHLVAHVRVPKLSSTTDTTILMCYGNPTVGSQQNPSAVWDADFKGVWHMKETPTVDAYAYDSSLNDKDGTFGGAMQSDDHVAGKIGYALDFDGTNDNLQMPDPLNGQVFTLSAWAYLTAATGDWRTLMARTDSNDDYFDFHLDARAQDAATPYRAVFRTGRADSTYAEVQSDIVLLAGTWYHIVAIHNGTHLLFYRDGSLRNTAAESYDTQDSGKPLWIGGNSVWSTEYLYGRVDEVRVSSAIRSGAWIAAEYSNQNNPSSFYSIGMEWSTSQKRKSITIDHTKVAGDLTDHPVLVDLYDADLKARARPDGADISFFVGTKFLAHEIENYDPSYNATHAHLVAWVRVPSLSAGTDTTIWMSYGGIYTSSTENPSAVWDANYGAVWHLSDAIPDSSSRGVLDSTNNNNDGTPYNFEDGDGGRTTAIGQIDGAAQMVADDHISVWNPINAKPTTQLTLSAWVKVQAPRYGEVVTMGDCYALRVRADGDAEFFKWDGGWWVNLVASGSNVADGKWHNIVGIQNSTGMFLLVDGVQKASNSNTAPIVYKSPDKTEIGMNGGLSPDPTLNFTGSIDEVRISTTARPAKSLVTSYNNQKDASRFCAVSAEQAAPGISSVEFRYKKTITVDHTKVAADLTNFPVLVSLYDKDLRTDVQSNGDDIVFKIGSQLLSHEIELFDQAYNSTHARLIAWVRVPFLSSATNTEITMFYGNSAIGSQQNKAGVWDSRYFGVWHLGETSGNALDSTSYGTQGTPAGGTVRGATGAIGRAFDFDGVDDTVSFGDPTDGHLDPGTMSFTYSMWVRIDRNTANYQVVFYKGGSTATDRGYSFETAQDASSMYALISDGTTSSNPTGYSTPVTLGTWMHLVAVVNRTSGTLVLYRDGLNTGQRSLGTIGSLSSTTAFRLSRTSYPTDAIIDEARVWNFAATADWISTEYANEKTPSAFYSIGNEVALANDPETQGGFGIAIGTNSLSEVSVSMELTLSVSLGAQSLADDLSPGTSFSSANNTLTSWTVGVLVSRPSELQNVSFSIYYPAGRWVPLSVTDPSGIVKSTPANWTFADGVLTSKPASVDTSGLWKIGFQDDNQISDLLMGLTGGPVSGTARFSVGDRVDLRAYATGKAGSIVELSLFDPNGSLWFYNKTAVQGIGFPVAYRHRKDLLVNHSKVLADLTDFPMLVDLYDRDLRTDVKPDGSDIVFVVGDRVVEHEMESFVQNYNGTHARLTAWVRVPLLSSSVDTTVSMYYTNPSVCSHQSPKGVFDSDYLGVWHLAESGNGTANEYKDSSKYDNNGQGGEGQSLYVPQRVAGKIGYAQDLNNLDGKYDLIDCGDSPLWDITGTQITLQAWIKHQIAPQDHVYGIMNHKGWFDGYSLWIDKYSLKITFNLPGDTNQLEGANDVTTGTWHHIVAAYDGAYVRIYIDGVQDPNTIVKTNNIEASSSEKGFWIGHGDQPKDVAWSGEFVGQIDEVRVSRVARSANWIKTEFNNQGNPSAFCSIGNEKTSGSFGFTNILLDSTAPAGVWQAQATYLDNTTNLLNGAGLFTRGFIVVHNTGLTLAAPGDAVSDHLCARQIGDQLYVELNLSDAVNTESIHGASVTMNWTAGGAPTNIQLVDYGDGRYGKTLNTSDLQNARRWRIDFRSYHLFYNNATNYLYLDLSHTSYLSYQTPTSSPYGDDFLVRITVRDSFNGAFLTGASFSSNGTIIGTPVSYGNGSYLVTIDSAGRLIGSHAFRITATPSSTYMLPSSIDVTFTLRAIETDAYATGSNPVSVPWGNTVSTTLHYYDTDHGNVGVSGGTVSGSVSVQFMSIGGGDYSVTMDVRSFLPGTYVVQLTVAKTNYKAASTSITVVVRSHWSSVAAYCNVTTPVGVSTYILVSFYDIDKGSVPITSGNLSLIVANWGSGSSSHTSYGFWLNTQGWSVGVHQVNLTAYAKTSPRYYYDASLAIQVQVRKQQVILTWEHLDPIPNGDDFVMFLHVNVSEHWTLFDGDPVNSLPSGYFSARNQSGGSYTINVLFLSEGRYRLLIGGVVFSEGDYTIIVSLDFGSTDNYSDTSTPVVTFTYRATLTYLSSPDYPQVTTTYNTNVNVTLHYVDVDRDLNITSGTISAQGASVFWKHSGNGFYEVMIVVAGWDLGAHGVNLTADATGYDAKTLTFEVLVQIAYAYARSSIAVVDLPVGSSTIFWVDYWDITHDQAILGASFTHNWTHSVSVTWTGTQYQLEFPSLDTDFLGSYLVTFNVSKGANYQFGYFNVSVSLRTHYTEFRLGSVVEPTSHAGIVNVSVYYGDLDTGLGIVSPFIQAYLENQTGIIPSVLVSDLARGNGYYILRTDAANFGGVGFFNFTVHFNWTGTVRKYYNGTVTASVNIIGLDSKLALIDSPGPTPYLHNMSYIYLYSELFSGEGISNFTTGNVFVSVSFVEVSVDDNEIGISEPSPLSQPGSYVIEFSTTILGRPGLYTMIVHVNWSAGVQPFYPNRTDTVLVRVLARNTQISLTPPSGSAYGVGATLYFSFDDVADGLPQRIANSTSTDFSLSLSDYTITYNSTSKLYRVFFNTSVLGASLGSKSFTIDAIWSGAPYYANITGYRVLITVLPRETLLDYPTPNPTFFKNNVTYILTYIDVTEGESNPINVATVVLFNGSTSIPSSFYSCLPRGNGQYEIEFNTTYFGAPGSYGLTAKLTASLFYFLNESATRTLSVRYRLTTLTSEPVVVTPYNSSLQILLHYRDLLTLREIGNGSQPTTLRILNGSSWFFTSVWVEAAQYYLVTVQTYNHALTVGTPYVLWFNISYASTSPYYLSAAVHVAFQMRYRVSTLNLITPPIPAAYLDYVNMTIQYRDVDASSGISNALLAIRKGATALTLGSDFFVTPQSGGLYSISVKSTSLGLGTTSVTITAAWTTGAPYHENATLILQLTVTTRPTSVEILEPPAQTRFLENTTFVFQYIDSGNGSQVTVSKTNVLVFSGPTQLAASQFSMTTVAGGNRISINSTILSSGLILNWNVTLLVDWNAGVAPYYSDSLSSVRVTVNGRVGVVTLGGAPTVPIGDNMSLSFTFTDESTGKGIGNSIVEFDCFDPSGLEENADYWVVRGSGSDVGKYTVLVNTTHLGDVRAYVFKLRLLWNPSVSPYYTNKTTMQLTGSVRLIRTLLTNNPPDPPTVPIAYNVSLDLYLTDIDHSLPVSDANTGITIRYKSTGTTPAIWDVVAISSGHYRLTVNCSDAAVTGTDALLIRINLYPYQSQEIQVPFQIRLRECEFSALMHYNPYFGESTFVILYLVDLDASNRPLPGASLTLGWPKASSFADLGDGRYNITLSTTALTTGLYSLSVSGQASDYSVSDIEVVIEIRNIPVGLVLPGSVPDVIWGENITLFAIYTDALHGLPISGATVRYEFGQLEGYLTENVSIAGNYSFSIDTGRLVLATTYLVSLTASRPNYATATEEIAVKVLKLTLDMTVVSNQSQQIHKGDSVNVTVYVEDTYNSIPTIGATVTVSWIMSGDIVLQPVLGQPGYYSGYVPTSSALAQKTYLLEIRAERNNYLTVFSTITVSVVYTPTVLWLDTETSGYAGRTFNWSDVIRIGVYVLSVPLNATNPLSTGVADCAVTWSLSGTSITGQFENGTDIGGLGYFYFDFDTSEYAASTYAMRITARHNTGAFADATNRTILTILSVATTVVSPYVPPIVWGWTGWINLIYWDLVHNVGVDDATAELDWEGGAGQIWYLGAGNYSLFINASLVAPGVYSITVNLWKPNYEGGVGLITLRVLQIPTEIKACSPTANLYPTDTELRVPYGDTIDISLFYNDTEYNRGIPGATDISATVTGPFIQYYELVPLNEVGGGNYSLAFDSTRWGVSAEPYIVTITMQLPNRSMAFIELHVTIINVPTDLIVEGPVSVVLSYSQPYTIWVFYRDNWTGHTNQGIAGGLVNATSLNPLAVVVVANASDVTRPGWYSVTVLSLRSEGSAIVVIQLGKANYDLAVSAITVRVEPSSTDILIEQAIRYGVPIGVIILIGAVLWARVFSVPKLLRRINRMVKVLKKGDVPKPLSGVRTRQQMVADLFNDTMAPLSVTKSASDMPKESISIKVPEVEELLVQLSLLTGLSAQELSEFRDDVSKMKLSEQVAFTEEVIHQEAIKRARAEGKTTEQVEEETAARAKALLSGEATEPETVPKRGTGPIIQHEEAERIVPEYAVGKPETVPYEDLLTEHEIQQLRKDLERAGVPSHELATIIEQVRKLPRELVDDLIDSVLSKGGDKE